MAGRFTAEQTETLRRMWMAGMVIKQIAYATGRSQSGVQQKARRLGMPQRHANRGRRNRIVVRLDEDIFAAISAAAIAEGVPIYVYAERLLSERLPPPLKQRLTAEQQRTKEDDEQADA